MAKKNLYFTEAERLYVIEQCTINEIAQKLNLAEKTVRNWKEEGGWEHKRLQYLRSRQAFHEELYEFARTLMKTIKEDMETGERIDPGRMYAFTRLLPMIVKVKDYEEAVRDSKKDDLNIEDVIKKALSEALGDA